MIALAAADPAVRAPQPGTPAAGAGAGSLAAWLAGATACAAATETVLLRLATRAAIHVPGIEAVAAPYGIVAAVGRFAHHAASLLVAVTLALLARALVRQGRALEAAAAVAVVAASVGARLGVVTDLTLAVALGAAVVVLAVAAVALRCRARASVALFAAAFVLAAVHAAAQDLAGSGALRPAGTAWLLVAAEALVLAAVAALVWALPGARRSDLVLGGATAMLAVGAFSATAATSTILLLWTFGLAGYFPAVLYAAGAGLLVGALGPLGREDRRLAVSLALIALGGIGLHSSYQSALVVCGLALLVASRFRASPAGG